MRGASIFIFLGIAAASALFVHAAAADETTRETPEVVEAPDVNEAPGAAPAPPQPAGLMLQYEQLLYDAPDNDLQRQIDVDLIDLDRLREALDTQLTQDIVRLSLQECILIALEQNSDILIAEYEPMRAAADVYAARGEFDPILAASVNYTKSKSALSQQEVAFGGISAIEAFRTQSDMTLSGRLQHGTQYQLRFGLNKEATTFGRLIAEWDSTLTLTLTQPLLRGLGKRVNTVRIRAARNAQAMTEAQLQLQVMNVLSEVTKAYWDLVGAIENLKVREESLENAERLLRINETRRDIGTAADIEVLTAKAGVATRQSEVINARSFVGDAEDRLKQLLDLRDGEYFSKARVVPIDRPELEFGKLINTTNFDAVRDASVERALDLRPELHMAELEIRNAELEQDRARNDMLPQVDVIGSVTQGGRDRGRSGAIYGIREGENRIETIGVQGSVSLGNRAARGQHERARLSRRQSELRLEQTRQNIMTNVHLAARNALKNSVLVETSQQSVNFSRAEVTAEEKRLRLGVTTSYVVLQKQEDLTAAQVQELQSRINYEKALIDLYLADGSLLEILGVAYEGPEAARPMGYFPSLTPWVN